MTVTRPRARSRRSHRDDAVQEDSFKPVISLTQAITDSSLLGKPFASSSFWTWKTVAKLIDGLPLDPREMDLYRKCTGRTELPRSPVKRLVILVGRRGGKDRFFSSVAVWRAALCQNWKRWLSPGEQGVVILMGADKKQASILRGYANGLLSSSLLKQQVERITDEIITFRNGAALEIVVNDSSLVRGRSAIAVMGSECCFWQTGENSASSDSEVVGAAEPSMAMTPDGGLMVMWSSVYRRRGWMYSTWKKHWGDDNSETLVWLAPSLVMNPRLSERVVGKAVAEDAAKANAEYNSVWRSDLQSFVSHEAVEACVSNGIVHRPWQPGRAYAAFCDPSGGSSDSFTLAIGHFDAAKQVAVIDCLRERKPPLSPEQTCAEFADVLRSYKLAKVVSDRYAGMWPVEQFGKVGILCEQSARPKSELYLDLLPLLNSARVDLVDEPKCFNQLVALERRTAWGGRDSIDHPPGQHDDLSNAVAGCCSLLTGKGTYDLDALAGTTGDDDEHGIEHWRAMRMAAYLSSGGRVIL